MLPIPAPLIDSTRAISIFTSNHNNNSSKESAYQHSRFFLPLISLGATASLCYLFLFTIVASNNQHSQHRSFHSPTTASDSNAREAALLFVKRVQLLPLSLRNRGEKEHNSDHVARSRSTLKPSGIPGTEEDQRKRKQEKDQLLLSSSFLLPTQPFVQRKTLHSLRKKTEPEPTSKHGTRRSNSTKVRSGHQDLGKFFFKTTPRKEHHHDHNDQSKFSGTPEIYKYPWINDEQCKTFKIQFAKINTFKPRALVSFPGSGNSWLRYLIESASGYFTGSVYNDSKLFNAGLLGERRPPNDGTTIVQKTHHDTVGNQIGYLKLSELMFGYRGILVIRNPYDALVAYWNFLNNHGVDKHTGVAKRSEFHGKKWVHFVTTKIPLWTSLIMSWVENSQDYLIVFFEDIQKNPRAEVIRILEYLEQPVNTTRLDCLTKPKNLEGPFHRAQQPSGEMGERVSAEAGPLLPGKLASLASSTLSQQNTNAEQNHRHRHHHDHQNDEQTLLLLNSKKSQHRLQHPQSPLSLPASSSTAQTTTSQQPVGGKREEQKEDKFLSPPPQTISPTPSQHFQQNQESSNMTSSSSSSPSSTASIKSNDSHHPHNSNNRPNNSSILRLDLIIQDNIDKINRFFQQKSILVQLHYSPRPSTISYFLQTYSSAGTF